MTIKDSTEETVAYQSSGKMCRDCASDIEFLCDFPGPRCLRCWEVKMADAPLERPDFAATVRSK